MIEGDDDKPVNTGFDDLEITATVTPETVPPVEDDEGTVTPPAPSEVAVALTPEGKEAAKSLVAMPAEFGSPQMVALARDMAQDLHPMHVLLRTYGLTNAQFEFILQHNEFFKAAVAQLAQEWNSIKNTAERLKFQSLAALEAQLPSIAARMGKQSEKLVDAVEAAKLLAKIGGVDGSGQQTHALGERFTIQIDLGADTRITVGNEGAANQGAQTIEGSAVRSDHQGAGAVPALPGNAKAPARAA